MRRRGTTAEGVCYFFLVTRKCGQGGLQIATGREFERTIDSRNAGICVGACVRKVRHTFWQRGLERLVAPCVCAPFSHDNIHETTDASTKLSVRWGNSCRRVRFDGGAERRSGASLRCFGRRKKGTAPLADSDRTRRGRDDRL